MTEKYFLDTNVLVYAFDLDDSRKQRLAKTYLQRLILDEQYVISWQVLNECCQVILKKLTPHISVAKLEQFASSIPEQRIVPFSKAVLEKTLRIHQHVHFSFWDSLIVATAMLSGCDTLLTEDLSHGQTIEHLTIINPFREDS